MSEKKRTNDLGNYRSYLELITIKVLKDDLQKEIDYLLKLNDSSKSPHLNELNSSYSHLSDDESKIRSSMDGMNFPDFTKHQNKEIDAIINKKDESFERLFALKYNPSNEPLMQEPERKLKNSLEYLIKSINYKLDAMYELYLIQNFRNKQK